MGSARPRDSSLDHPVPVLSSATLRPQENQPRTRLVLVGGPEGLAWPAASHGGASTPGQRSSGPLLLFLLGSVGCNRGLRGRQVMETLGPEREGWTGRKAEAELRERLVRVEKRGWRRPAPLTFFRGGTESRPDRR
jgi:hypothetical protein